MSLAAELDRLDRLHREGALSDEEFVRAKACLLDGAPRGAAGPARIATLRRSRDERWLGGVCGGLAALSSTPAWLWRVLFLLAVTCAGTGILLYLLLWIFVPEADDRDAAVRTA